jgi:pyruvate dehydrogenase E2 component (dihydrolipoamide acetyltransferase)
MIEEIIMPRMGDSAADCSVEEWRKSIGDSVEMGEVICVVATDKATFDIESPYEGMLVETLVQVNVNVPPGTPIARIAMAEESVT